MTAAPHARAAGGTEGRDGRSALRLSGAELAVVAIAVLTALVAVIGSSRPPVAGATAADAAVGSGVTGSAPAVGPPSAAGSAPVAATDVSSVTSLIPGSPLPAALLPPSELPVGGRVDPVAAVPPPDVLPAPPVALSVVVLGLFGAPVVPVGVDAAGDMEVPDIAAVGWYRFASRPGAPGHTVLAAHVAFDGERGVFARLSELQAGDRVEVAAADGTSSTWEVASVGSYAKAELPVEELFAVDGDETLVLVTCGGAIDPARGSHGENVVVRARRAAA